MHKVRHRMIIGRTGSGKSYFAIQQAKQHAPCLFFNVQALKLGNGWHRATGSTNMDDIIFALRKGYKVDFVPSMNIKQARRQLDILWFYIAQMHKDIVFIVDEIAVIAPQGGKQTAAAQIALRGRSLGVEGWFISQRPASADKNILTQCSDVYIFDLHEKDIVYLENMRIKAIASVDAIRAAGEYHYVHYDGVSYSAPRKE